MNGGGGLAAGPSTHPAPPQGTRQPQPNPFHISPTPTTFPQKHSSTSSHHVSLPPGNQGAKTYTPDEVWLAGRERLRPTAKKCGVRINDHTCDAELVTDRLHTKHLQRHLDQIVEMATANPDAPPRVWLGNIRAQWDNFQDLRNALNRHAHRNWLCAVENCPDPHLIRPEAHYKNNHTPSEYREDLFRPPLALTPGKLHALPPLPASLPAYKVTTHEIRPFCERPLPAISAPGPRLRELREDIVEERDVDDVPFVRPGALWDSSDFATLELEDDDEPEVIGQVQGAPVIRMSLPPPTPLQGGRMRKRAESQRASSVLSDASWAPSVAPSSPVGARTVAPRASAASSQPAIREETPFSMRAETPTPSTPKRALRQTPSAEQPIFIPPPTRKRTKPVFAKNQVLLTTVTLPEGPLPVPSASRRGAKPIHLVKTTGKPREIPQPLDYILARAEAARKAKEAKEAQAVKQELPASQTSMPPSSQPPSSLPPSQLTGTQVSSSQASLAGPSQAMLPPPTPSSQPLRPTRGKRKASPGWDDEEVVGRAAEEWAFAKTGRYCGISFWEHKMAFRRAVEQRQLANAGTAGMRLFAPTAPIDPAAFPYPSR